MLYRTPKLLQKIYPKLTWERETHGKELFLTFDDGPIPDITEFVLETLATFQAEATFFCIGDNIIKHPEIFQKICAAEHAIGNHTMHHLKGWKTDNEAYAKDITACQKEIEKTYLNASKKLFRPPYGRIKKSQIAGLPADFETIMWTTLSQDYRQDISPEACLKNTIKATKPGSIIVFHDSLKAQKNMTYALPRFLEEMISSGFTFKAL